MTTHSLLTRLTTAIESCIAANKLQDALPLVKTASARFPNNPDAERLATAVRILEDASSASSSSSSAQIDYFRVLGIEREDSADLARQAFRRFSLQLHPDKHTSPAASRAFLIAKEAWECLTNDVARREHLRALTTGTAVRSLNVRVTCSSCGAAFVVDRSLYTLIDCAFCGVQVVVSESSTDSHHYQHPPNGSAKSTTSSNRGGSGGGGGGYQYPLSTANSTTSSNRGGSGGESGEKIFHCMPASSNSQRDSGGGGGEMVKSTARRRTSLDAPNAVVHSQQSEVEQVSSGASCLGAMPTKKSKQLLGGGGGNNRSSSLDFTAIGAMATKKTSSIILRESSSRGDAIIDIGSMPTKKSNQLLREIGAVSREYVGGAATKQGAGRGEGQVKGGEETANGKKRKSDAPALSKNNPSEPEKMVSFLSLCKNRQGGSSAKKSSTAAGSRSSSSSSSSAAATTKRAKFQPQQEQQGPDGLTRQFIPPKQIATAPPPTRQVKLAKAAQGSKSISSYFGNNNHYRPRKIVDDSDDE